jgi:NAD(P)-dependent dehydrogenase (short-subunit alcohol dehydrogenase family)
MTVVVVTGASAGVGRAVVRRFAQDGARIGLIARSTERLEAAAGEVREMGGEALVLPLDTADADAVEAAAARTRPGRSPAQNGSTIFSRASHSSLMALAILSSASASRLQMVFRHASASAS